MTRRKHAPGYDALTDRERDVADENLGEVSCAAMNCDGFQCTRPKGHGERHTAFGGRFLGAWSDHESAREAVWRDNLRDVFTHTPFVFVRKAALAARGDVAPYSQVLALANAAVEKRGIEGVAALHYIDGYLAAAGEFSGKPGLYEGSYPTGSGETGVQAVRETTWPIYDTPCIPSCRAAGPVTHTRGCHNNGKISPAEAASGNYDREPSSLSSGTVSG